MFIFAFSNHYPIMKIKSARYVISNAFVEKCPQTSLPEYAFIGRSNVGKSSLINALTNTKGLAKTSSTPGKTTLINHFIINDEWWLVDLPGYGYATMGKKERTKLEYTISRYILERQSLTAVCVLVDIRHKPQRIDVEFIEWLGENGVPFIIIFTKADKLSGGEAARNVAAYKRFLKETWEELPTMFVTSSAARTGTEDVLSWIEDTNASLNSQN